MTPEESRALYRVLCFVARADGEVDDEEEAVLLELGDGEAPESVTLLTELRRLRTPDARRATYDAALAIASIDGVCTREEHAVLEHIRRALDIDDAPLSVAEADALTRLRAPRKRLAKVTADFLHSVGAAKDGLSQEAYEALLADLRARRTDILAGALPTL